MTITVKSCLFSMHIFQQPVITVNSCCIIWLFKAPAQSSHDWHLISLVDHSKTLVSFVKHLNNLQGLISNHELKVLKFSSASTFLLDCLLLSHIELRSATCLLASIQMTLWELMLIGTQKWTTGCTSCKFSFLWIIWLQKLYIKLPHCKNNELWP
jgi:hypothetical protein